MRKTTRDDVPKPTVFTRGKVPKGDWNEGAIGTYDYKTKERIAAKEALARMKEIEAERGHRMETVYRDGKTVVRVCRDMPENVKDQYIKKSKTLWKKTE